MSERPEDRQACAHAQVRYRTRPTGQPDGSVFGQWECTTCATQFYPRPQVETPMSPPTAPDERAIDVAAYHRRRASEVEAFRLVTGCEHVAAHPEADETACACHACIATALATHAQRLEALYAAAQVDQPDEGKHELAVRIMRMIRP
jgi:hypothetical protein